MAPRESQNVFVEVAPNVWAPANDGHAQVLVDLACGCGAHQRGHVWASAAMGMLMRWQATHAACAAPAAAKRAA